MDLLKLGNDNDLINNVTLLDCFAKYFKGSEDSAIKACSNKITQYGEILLDYVFLRGSEETPFIKALRIP